MGSSGSNTTGSSIVARKKSLGTTVFAPPRTTRSGRKDEATQFHSAEQHPRWQGSCAPVKAGERFGAWIVIDPTFNRSMKERRISCRCFDCGTVKLVDWGNLRSGKSRGCLCHSGQSMQPYRELWQRRVGRRLTAARNRCRNPHNSQWKSYGERGITFDFSSTREGVDWVTTYLGAPSDPKLELDRIDNDRGYAPGNLRWATRREQMLNTRRSQKSMTS